MANEARAARSRARAGASQFARIAAGLVLLGLLVHWRLIDPVALRAPLNDPGLLGLALAATIVTVPLEALRWHVLLRAQGLRLRLAHTTRILASSLFLSNFLPGGAGGDLVRAYYVCQAARSRRTVALLSIVVDRAVGLIGFATVGLLLMALEARLKFGALELSLVLVSAGLIAGVVIVAFFGGKVGRLLLRLLSPRRARLAQVIFDASEAFRQYARDWPTVGVAILLSLVIALFSVAPLLLLADAVGLSGVTPLDYAIAALYAQLANSLPATPGGIGVGETAFASLCTMLSPHATHAAYGTVFLAYRCIFIVATLPGLLAYMTTAPQAEG
jgi:glycosyltransferase 2 family protein